VPSIHRIGLICVAAFSLAAAQDFRLEQLDLANVQSLAPPMGYPARAARSVADQPLKLNGAVFEHGLGLHSGSTLRIDLAGQAQKFTAQAGLDDAPLPLPKPLANSDLPTGLKNHPGTATVEIWVDGKSVFDTGNMRRGQPPKSISVDLEGARRMTIIVTDAGRWPYNNPVDLADAVIAMKPGATAKPKSIRIPAEAAPRLAAADTLRPAIHGPRVTGASVGRPFFYAIPATGASPLRFAASNLPAGLTLDPQTGFITGALKTAGETVVRLEVSSARGKDTRELKIVGGDRPLALTPPLGWNSWNVWARAVDDARIRQAANAMVSSGLAAHGFTYINIDDAWMGERDASGEIHPNEKFPDMIALAQYVHSKGLKLGIYSSPGPVTCQRLPGSYQHEAQDAATYARWSIDYLKYDQCSYSSILKGARDRASVSKPYAIMGDALKKSPRDIVYSLCQYGMANVWEWGPGVGGQLWRTTGDIRDSWESISEIGFSQAGHEKWAGPGHWNDPDMLVVGSVGWGVELHKSRLTPNEQMTHIGLWSLLAAPLLLGCDLTQIDPVTLRLLTNDEVLDVNQDPLGKQAAPVARDGLLEVWARPLWDGTQAVGLFNRGIEPAKIAAKWSDLGLTGRQPVRDLWQRKDLGTADGSFQAEVPPHGVVLVKIGRPQPGAGVSSVR
jgi:alpha-galactosidase